MTVDELIARFPEIPADLHDEATLTRLADRFGDWLATATKPSACAEDHTPEHRAYLKLIGPMDIYRYGLSSREKVLDQIEALLAAYASDPSAFRAELEAG